MLSEILEKIFEGQTRLYVCVHIKAGKYHQVTTNDITENALMLK